MCHGPLVVKRLRLHQKVDQFFTGTNAIQRGELIRRWHITVIAAEGDRVLADLPVVFQSGDVTLYRANP